MDFHAQMSVLIQLSLIDKQLAPVEKRMVYAIGKANRMPEKAIDRLFEKHLSTREHALPSLDGISDDDKYEYLYSIVQLMKVDMKVYLSEIRFCEDLAEKLGFKKQVVGALSKQIFSDPGITTDMEVLTQVMKNYKIS